MDRVFKSFFKVLTNVDSEFHWTSPLDRRIQEKDNRKFVLEFWWNVKLLLLIYIANECRPKSWSAAYYYILYILLLLYYYIICILLSHYHYGNFYLTLKWREPPINLLWTEITITYICNWHPHFPPTHPPTHTLHPLNKCKIFTLNISISLVDCQKWKDILTIS